VSGAREIPDPGFPDDTGAADAALAAALGAYAADPAGPGRYAAVLAALGPARVVVPVVAVLGESETGADGLVRDKSADMAAVLLQRPDGRRALLAFTGTDALARWDPDARPVPVPTRTAAQAALQEEAAALVLDVAGPVQVAVSGDDLTALAAGWRLARLDAGGDAAGGTTTYGWIGPGSE